ncbi:MAG: YdcF family protein [Mogibacterium sp.]|nr:YdcF family protein [Mogibacterium sp.]
MQAIIYDLYQYLNILPLVLTVTWLAALVLIIVRPQRLSNCFLLLLALLETVVWVTTLFGDNRARALFIAVAIILVIILLVPVMLIWNGFVMIRRESASLANILSLLLGVFIGVGEIALIVVTLSSRNTFTGRWAAAGGELSNVLLFIGLSVFYVSVLILSFVLYTIFIQLIPHVHNYRYVIIHGCGLIDGEKVSRLLASRVDKAMELYDDREGKTFLIASGGRGEDEKLSEAEAMKRYMLERGIPADRILLEDQSKTTEENVRFSARIIGMQPGRRKVALVSSNYHVYRCLVLAQECGLKCIGIGAKVAAYYWPSAVIREFVAVFSRRRHLLLSLQGYLFFVVAPLVLV